MHFKSVRLNKYLCAENGGGSTLVANRRTPRSWETFRVSFLVSFSPFVFPSSLVTGWSNITVYLLNLQLWRIDESTFNFRVSNKDFIGLSGEGEGIRVVAHAAEPGPNETFIIVRNVDNPSRVRILASNNLYLQVNYF